MTGPEKIYLFENPISGTPDDRWLVSRSSEDDVEYTRTDAFIEKAIKFLKPTVYVMCCGNRQDSDEYIEDFKNYMKGELYERQ